MDAIECITSRRSVRKFLPDPVKRETIEEILSAAMRAPSYKNTQPWEVLVLSGKKKEEFTAYITRLLDEGRPQTPDIPEPSAWPPLNAGRISENMTRRSKEFGIDLNAPDVLIKSKKANFRFYGAPHGIFLYQDASLPVWSIFDLGLFAQSLMLAACAKGVGTVPQAFLADFAKEAKEFLGIPESKRLALGISMGYGVKGDKVNQYRTNRAPITEIVKWLE